MILLDTIVLLFFVMINISVRNWLGWDRLWVQNVPDISIIIVATLTIIYIVADSILLLYRKNFFLEISKAVIFTLIVAFLVGYPLYATILSRHKSVAYVLIHDGALQTEIAARFLLHGKNPYASTFFGTPMQSWAYHDVFHPKEINPGLYHYIYFPFSLLTGLVGQLVQKVTIGWEDLRFTLFVEYLAMVAVVFILVRKMSEKYLYLSLFALNPFVIHFLLEGRNDTAAFFYLLASAFFMYKKNIFLSAVFLGFSFAFKQTLWLAIPFFLCYVFFDKKVQKDAKKFVIVFLSTSLICVLPFFLWNPVAFINSTIGYPSGTVAHSYPISGIGFGQLLLLLNIIPDSRNYFPFWIPQALFCLPLLVFFLIKLAQKPKISYIFLFYAVSSLVYLYFSRIFSDSYVVPVMLSLGAALLFYQLEESRKSQ